LKSLKTVGPIPLKTVGLIFVNLVEEVTTLLTRNEGFKREKYILYYVSYLAVTKFHYNDFHNFFVRRSRVYYLIQSCQDTTHSGLGAAKNPIFEVVRKWKLTIFLI